MSNFSEPNLPKVPLTYAIETDILIHLVVYTIFFIWMFLYCTVQWFQRNDEDESSFFSCCADSECNVQGDIESCCENEATCCGNTERL